MAHRGSYDDHFEIGLHDALDVEALPYPIELVEIEALSAPRLGHGFEGDVQAHDVPEPEAVRHSSGYAVNPYIDALDSVRLHANVEECGRNTDHSNWRRLEARNAASSWHGDPYMVREL
ncbi:MAG TPA: hypothetical protein VLN08_15360, partial [Vicinamibacterales bacterium]|nr:hypothetical protein [Vicinamibacterales bacterium]